MATYQSSNGFRTGSKTPVSILQELLLRNNIVPQYELIHNGVGTHEPQFRYKLQAGGFTAIGCGKSKKEAKHDAARSILKRMHFNKALTESAHVEPAEDIDIESPYSGAVKENLVGQLTDLCVINNLPQQEYIPIREEGPPHARIFTFECLVSTRSETAIARTKKQAKHMVSQQMINRLSDILGDRMVQVPEKFTDPDTDEGYEPDGTPLLMLEGVKRNQLNLGLPNSQYHKLISDTTDSEPIPILEDLKDRSLSWIHSHPSPEILLEELALQLKAKLEVKLAAKTNYDAIDDVDFIDLTEQPIDSDETNEEPLNNGHHDDETQLKNDSESNEEKSTAVVTIDSSPQRVFFGSGKLYTEAVKNAAVNALTFYFFMAQPLDQEFDWRDKTIY